MIKEKNRIFNFFSLSSTLFKGNIVDCRWEPFFSRLSEMVRGKRDICVAAAPYIETNKPL